MTHFTKQVVVRREESSDVRTSWRLLRVGLAFPLPPEDGQARGGHGGSDERQFAGGALVSDHVHHQQGRSDHGQQGCCECGESRERGFGSHGSAANEGALFYRCLRPYCEGCVLCT